jgi:hypothetical protein
MSTKKRRQKEAAQQLASRQAIGKFALYKGKNAEERSLLAITSHYRDPELFWVVRARRATKLEDRKGIDIVVQTSDIGRLFIQIKSSRRGADKFLREHSGSKAAVVIVREEYSDAQVLRAVKRILLELRTCRIRKLKS